LSNRCLTVGTIEEPEKLVVDEEFNPGITITFVAINTINIIEIINKKDEKLLLLMYNVVLGSIKITF
jgi:hypothetical protein